MRRFVLVLLIVALIGALCGYALAEPAHAVAIPDEAYLQEVGRVVKTDTPVLTTAFHDGGLYVGTTRGVRLLKNDTLAECAGPDAKVHRVRSLGGSLYALTGSGLYSLRDREWKKIADGTFRDVCLHANQVHAATENNVFRVDETGLTPVPCADKGLAGIQRIASYSESLYALSSGKVAVLDPVVLKGFDDINVSDWGKLQSKDTRDMLSLGNRLCIATASGLAVLRGMSMTQIRGADGLCHEDVTCLAKGFADDLWIGTTRGAIRAVNGEFQYFAGTRWLPGDNVLDIAVGDRTVCMATDAGLGLIDYEPYTLLKKAAYYERHLDEWGQKRIGFTHKLEWNEDKGEWVREISDNDAGWSTHYLAAQCFKYAATGDEQARKEAVYFFESLKWTEEISSIPGFPARSVWGKGETGNRTTGGSGGFPAEWIPTPDGLWAWKADTSSDETDAHFYATPIFHALVADEHEKKMAEEHLARIATHIIDNGWVLRDLDGEPTVWARWDPEYFNSERGSYARGLNGLEILSYMRTAAALTGDSKYDAAYEQILGFGYHRHVLRQKLVFPPDYVFHSDDRLAFYAYYPLLTYEKDPGLRSIYRRSFERSWEIERVEHNPWFNFIYAALTGNDCEADEAVKHLREWPLDMVDHRFENSHRHDLYAPAGYGLYSGGKKPLSPRERGPMRWSDSTLELDGGSDGKNVVDPSGWLEAYWMGRYYGFIAAPNTDDAQLTTVEKRGLQLGAVPYDGPPRPQPGTKAFTGNAEKTE